MTRLHRLALALVVAVAAACSKAGPAGTEGPAGPKGATGDKGADGQPGAPGMIGTVGPQGPPGAMGMPGPQGTAGVVDYSMAIANSKLTQANASFHVDGSGAVDKDFAVGGQIGATATWGQNALTLGILAMAEGSVADDGAGTLSLGATVIVMNPAAGSWIRVAAGDYTLPAWGYLYVDLPPTGNVRAVVTPGIGAWVDADRPYDARDRFILAQRVAGGAIVLHFQLPAAVSQPPSSLVTTVTGLADIRNNAGVSTAGSWYTLPGRTVVFTKRFAGSKLKITYQDTLGTLGQFYDGCEWQILLDGKQVAYFSDADVDGPFTWKMHNGAHVAWATAGNGAHTLLIQNRGSRGAWNTGTGTQECLSGWNAVGSFVSVEEVP